jgi:H+-translocating diphosphatase
LVSLALYGGFITNAKAYYKDHPSDGKIISLDPIITEPLVFASLLIGAMLPYAFSAFTMKSVGKAALEMVEEIRR